MLSFVRKKDFVHGSLINSRVILNVHLQFIFIEMNRLENEVGHRMGCFHSCFQILTTLIPLWFSYYHNQVLRALTMSTANMDHLKDGGNNN